MLALVLTTSRMALLPLTRRMIARRLSEPDGFTMECDLGDGPVPILFPPDWPGDPIVAFPNHLTTLVADDSEVHGTYTAIDRASSTAIGMLGTKGGPDAHRSVEIGYGFNPDVWGNGYTTEAVAALVDHLATIGLVTVTAETATTNLASQRVLEKNGFARSGTGWDEEDGDLILWKKIVAEKNH